MCSQKSVIQHNILHFRCFREICLKRAGEDGGDDGDGRNFSEHPGSILHTPRDNISRKGESLTPITCVKGVWDRIESLGDSWGPFICWAQGPGPYWAHLGDSFHEVIGFITTLAFPGCADGSVSICSRAPDRLCTLAPKPRIYIYIPIWGCGGLFAACRICYAQISNRVCRLGMPTIRDMKQNRKESQDSGIPTRYADWVYRLGKPTGVDYPGDCLT